MKNILIVCFILIFSGNVHCYAMDEERREDHASYVRLNVDNEEMDEIESIPSISFQQRIRTCSSRLLERLRSADYAMIATVSASTLLGASAGFIVMVIDNDISVATESLKTSMPVVEGALVGYGLCMGAWKLLY